MNRDDARKLLGGYATGTLSEQEREALFRAALDDQELFEELAREQSLKELLDDSASRAAVRAELSRGKRAWWAAPWAWAGLGLTTATAAIILLMLTPRQEVRVEMARSRQPEFAVMQRKPEAPAAPVETRGATERPRAAKPPAVEAQRRNEGPLTAPAPQESRATEAAATAPSSQQEESKAAAPPERVEVTAAAPALNAANARDAVQMRALQQSAAAKAAAPPIRVERLQQGAYVAVPVSAPLRTGDSLRFIVQTPAAGDAMLVRELTPGTNVTIALWTAQGGQVHTTPWTVPAGTNGPVQLRALLNIPADPTPRVIGEVLLLIQ